MSVLDILAEANRVARRESLLEFTKDATPGYQAGWVHERICEELERVLREAAEGKRPRLAIHMPPRMGKSQLCSRCLPAWWLGHNPSDEVMIVSYSADLANSFSYDARDIVRRDWYASTFEGTRLSQDRASVTRWRTTEGGGVNPVGISGSITGSGADLLILDDTIKSEKQARSHAHREMIRDRYRSSIYNRLSPKGSIVHLSTRWHHDDLAGWLQAQERSGGDQWRVLNFPAIATEDEPRPGGGFYRRRGEALHPERFPLDMLEQIERVSGPHEWAALYQQDPTPEGGEFVKREWIQRFDLDAVLHDMTFVWDAICVSWDTAWKAKLRSDRTCVQVWGRKGANLYLLHSWAGKLDFAGVCDKAAIVSREWSVDKLNAKRIDTVIESRANGMGVIRYLQTHAGIPARPFDPQRWGSKTERANIMSGWFQQRRIFLPDNDRRYPWAEYAIRQWLIFPHGAHDDEVDAASQAVIWLGKSGGTGRPARLGPVAGGAKSAGVW